MPPILSSKSKPIQNDRIVYNDGRDGHKGIGGTILSVDATGMLVQWDDRASPTRIQFHDRAWMDYIYAA